MIVARPTNQNGFGGIVRRTSSLSMSAIAAMSARLAAAMYRSRIARLSGLGSADAVQSVRRSGRCRRRVGRARCRALLAEATLISSSSAVSAAGQPSTSRRISTARCLGGRCWTAARNNQLDRLPGDHHGVRPRLARGHVLQEVVRVRLQPGDPLQRLRAAVVHPRHRLVPQRPAGVTAQEVQAGVGSDPVQPAAEGGLSLEALALAPGLEEGLLHHVLGVVVRAEHAVAVHLQLPPVRLHQPGERPLGPWTRRSISPINSCTTSPSVGACRDRYARCRHAAEQ